MQNISIFWVTSFHKVILQGLGATLFSHQLTREAVDALAMEHLCLLHLAASSVLTRVGVARVVATLSDPSAIQHIPLFLLELVDQVIDVQHAYAAHKA